MLSIDPATNTERENYKLLIGSIIPRPIAFVTTSSRDGIVNGAPFSYFSIVSSNPPMISIAIQRKEGIQKDTARNINELKEFVIHIVDEQIVEKVNATAANLPPEQSEIELVNLTQINSTKISVPGIKEAKIRMECILEKSLALGGSDEPGCDLIIGRVVQFHVENDIYENGRINPSGLAAISRLAGQDYAHIGETFSLERPK
ncbi:flavin reductase family protein [Metabacillus rhizolycopersici]|jgi:flavin reductase (DIM6/NTAB) family NADH-FMN oxidoreductase RutF|uniref:Flavin reductase family protein n=1 Tax=Metabacillus rhizolycopersici TaxID=2875709 RepID=A0ABS7UU53_9BACI|nr:flavin reductase family protein [Metabacillus rhizolycopersici]MBZ5751850.1 flavin reductase family protein [Metabacillus rhizolycopersici]